VPQKRSTVEVGAITQNMDEGSSSHHTPSLPPSLPPSFLPSPPSQHDSPPSSTRASLGSDRKSSNLTDQVADLEEGLEGLREQKDARLRRIRATRERSGGGEEGREERRERGRDMLMSSVVASVVLAWVLRTCFPAPSTFSERRDC